MKKVKAIILDDELHGRETLEWQLEKYCPSVEVIAMCANPLLALDVVKANDFDILFLDIEMPEMSGFDFIEKLESIDFQIVFTTAFDEFALKAFRVSAIDYLVKPIDNGELQNAVNKIEATLAGSQNNQAAQVELLMSILKDKEQPAQVAFPTGEGLEMIDPNTILRCESESNYTRIYFIDGTKSLISRTLKEIEDLLDNYSFIRIHHSHLISLTQITRYVKGSGGYVIMRDGMNISVSRSRKDELLFRLQPKK